MIYFLTKTVFLDHSYNPDHGAAAPWACWRSIARLLQAPGFSTHCAPPLRNSRCDDSTQQLSMLAAAAAAERAPKRGARGAVAAAVRQLWRRQADRRAKAGLLCESRRDTAAQLWRTRNRKLLLKLTRGTSMVMKFQAMKKGPSKNKCAPKGHLFCKQCL